MRRQPWIPCFVGLICGIIVLCGAVPQRKRYQSTGAFILPTRRNSPAATPAPAAEDSCRNVACFAACKAGTCAPRDEGQCCDDLAKCTPGELSRSFSVCQLLTSILYKQRRPFSPRRLLRQFLREQR